jgi:hypothetical protein
MRECHDCGWHRKLYTPSGYDGGEPEEEWCVVIEENAGDYTDEERRQTEEYWNGNRLNCPCYGGPPTAGKEKNE